MYTTNIDLYPLIEFGMKGLFFILLFFFTVHAIFLAYHWFAFGNNKAMSMIALAAYLIGGAILLMTYAIALNTL